LREADLRAEAYDPAQAGTGVGKTPNPSVIDRIYD
jgi:hypothetical protein